MTIGKFSEYQQCFQWKGGGFPYIVSDIFMSHYKTLDCLIILAHGTWTTFLPRPIVEQTLNDGLERLSNTDIFEAYVRDFDQYKKDCTVYFENILAKSAINKADAEQAFVFLKTLFYFYSKTEFFYIDRAFEHAEKNEAIKKHLEQFDRIKNGGREYLNKCFIGPDTYLEHLLANIAATCSVSLADIKSLGVNEILALFDGVGVDNEMIAKRKIAYIVKSTDGNIASIEGVDAEKIADAFYVDAAVADSKMIKGIIANKGKVRGKVKVLEYSPDQYGSLARMIERMDQGDVLVADTTSPEFIVACKKASAILTNQGGMMSHAAIVSRELHIPCIVGLRNATEVLKDGDMVEVDADSGIVTIIT